MYNYRIYMPEGTMQKYTIKLAALFICSVFLFSACSGSEEKDLGILSKTAVKGEGYSENTESYKIEYLSDGLKVTGYMSMPKEMDESLPVIIFNRGGNREYGKLTDAWALYYFEFLASHGYIVLASQYRGNDGGEGAEEFGGSDLNDVLNLMDIGKNLPDSDGQIFMMGASRGGMMTYMACRASDDISAAVVICGSTSAIRAYNERGWEMKSMLETLIGGTPLTAKDEYIKRSAAYWADEIDTPLYIIHGANDKRVDISEAENMVRLLKKYGKDYEYVRYEDMGHEMPPDDHEAIFEWFDKYKNE